MKALLIAGLLLSAGCTTTFQNPMTSTLYKGEIKEEGLSLTITPPGWAWCVAAYRWIVD